MEMVAQSGEQQTFSWSMRDDISNGFEHSDDEPASARYRRQAVPGTREDAKVQYINEKRIYDVRMCSLYMQADHYLYNEVKIANSNKTRIS